MPAARLALRALAIATRLAAVAAGLALPVARAAADPVDLLSPGSHARVGLGGDPFLSPLRDETGWWNERGFWGGPGARLEATFSRPVSRSMIGGAALERREVTWDALRDLRVGAGTARIAARVSRPGWQGSWSDDRGGVALGGAGAAVELAARGPTPFPGLMFEIDAPAFDPAGVGRASSAGAGLRYDAGGPVALQASWNSVRAPEAIESNLRGEGFAASLNLHSDTYRLDGRVTLPLALALEGSLAQSSARSLRVTGESASFEIAPRGHTDLEQVALLASPTARTRGLARWTRRHLDADAELIDAGTSFGALEGARGQVESVLLGFERRGRPRARDLIEWEHARASASARAEVESWPFTSALVDLLGLRGIATLDASMRWSRVHAAVERGVGRALDLRGGVGWYDLAPDATVQSWRPMFLVFGRADLEVNRLRARRVQLGAASLGATLRAAGLGFDLGVRQFVFARVFQDAPASATPAMAPAVPVEGASPPQRRARVPGGTELQWSVSRAF